MIKSYTQFSLLLEAQQSLKLNVPRDVTDLHKLFKRKGRKLFVVGGAVRDAMLGIKPKDWDLATDAKPDEIVEILKSGGIPTIGEVGQQFGVVIAKTPSFKEGMEIATFRKDIGKGRRPDAVEFSTIDKDVLRRDLTINALFWDIEKQEVVDLVGGIADIQSGSIRTVGRAEERFSEDPLRKLRALRFAGRTGGKIEGNTADALMADNSLEGISPERIRDEFKKSITTAKSPKGYLQMLERFGMWPVMFPGMGINKKWLDSNQWLVQLASLFGGNDVDVIKKRLNAMSFSNDEIDAVLLLNELGTLSPEKVFELSKKRDRVKLDNRVMVEWAKLNRLDQKAIKAFIKYKPSTNGRDVVKQFGLKGPAIADKIKEIEAEKFARMLK